MVYGRKQDGFVITCPALGVFALRLAVVVTADKWSAARFFRMILVRNASISINSTCPGTLTASGT